MFGGNKIKLDKDLLERAKNCAEIAGYSSVEEFIAHIVEREIAELEETGDVSRVDQLATDLAERVTEVLGVRN